MAFPTLFPLTAKSATFASVATASSSYLPVFIAAAAGEVRRALFQNGTAGSATSGTTTGSSASVVLYKNASSAGSAIATFNGSGTTVSTLATAVLLTSGTTGSTNGRFVTGDLFIGELKGGEASVVGTGAYIAIEYVYARETGAAPTAGTGPA